MSREEHHSKGWGGERQGSGRKKSDKLYRAITFKVEVPIADNFKIACDNTNVSQASALRELMKVFVAQHDRNDEEEPVQSGEHRTFDLLS